MRERCLSGILCCGLVLASCSEVREVQPRSVCFDFDREVAPALEASCLECHRPGVTDSIYYVDSLPNIFARDPRTGASRLDGGAGSAFLVAARGEDEVHDPTAAEALSVLTAWVVDCQTSTVRTEGVHPGGWVNPVSEEFHGRALAIDSWDFRSCISCHGQVSERGGGKSGVSCLQCHAEGPTTCTTCHGAEAYFSLDPGGGLSTRVHRAHLLPGETLGLEIACEECHRVPTDWREAGHVWGRAPRSSDGQAGAEVELEGLAAANIPGLEARRPGPPTYSNRTCSNIYCHGHTLGDESNVSIARLEPAGEASCELCHGMPPAHNHPEDLELSDCTTCHARVIDDEGNIIDPSLHLDGELSIGAGLGCTECHGSDSPAPPPSLAGETDPTARGVGAHTTHLTASALAPAMPCSGCHLVPAGDTYQAAVAAEGHMDSALPADVFSDPAGLAFADGAQPSYDPVTGTCSNAYCHGGGQQLLEDQSASVARDLSWTDDAGAIFCGRCHGIAPDTPGHPNVSDRTTCRFCHSDTVDDDGQIIIGPEGSTHINGVVDL